jgi:hypothetical protein
LNVLGHASHSLLRTNGQMADETCRAVNRFSAFSL